MLLLSKFVLEHVLYPQSLNSEQIQIFASLHVRFVYSLRYLFAEQVVEFPPLILYFRRDIFFAAAAGRVS